jgi:hypothetical protein
VQHSPAFAAGRRIDFGQFGRARWPQIEPAATICQLANSGSSETRCQKSLRIVATRTSSHPALMRHECTVQAVRLETRPRDLGLA